MQQHARCGVMHEAVDVVAAHVLAAQHAGAAHRRPTRGRHAVRVAALNVYREVRRRCGNVNGAIVMDLGEHRANVLLELQRRWRRRVRRRNDERKKNRDEEHVPNMPVPRQPLRDRKYYVS